MWKDNPYLIPQGIPPNLQIEFTKKMDEQWLNSKTIRNIEVQTYLTPILKNGKNYTDFP